MIFRRLSKSGTIGEKGISTVYFNLLFKDLVKKAGILHPEEYSSHSLRRGFATEAYRRGQDPLAIQVGGRWRSIRTVYDYIDASQNFKEAAVNALFDFGKKG